jgi:DNA polymerase-2
MSQKTITGFILTTQILEDKGGLTFSLWVKTDVHAVELRFSGQDAVFFVGRHETLPNGMPSHERKPLGLKSFAGSDVDGLYFKKLGALREAKDLLDAKGIRTFESDIRPVERFLMERFIHGSIEFSIPADATLSKHQVIFNPPIRRSEYRPNLRSLSLDIETGRDGTIYSIGSYVKSGSETISNVLMRGQGQNSEWLEFVASEKELLLKFEQYLNEWEPDLIWGWHVIGFDLNFMQNRSQKLLGRALKLGRNSADLNIIERNNRRLSAKTHGRCIIDGPVALRSAFYQFNSFKLESVAQELLGKGKDINESGISKVEEIERRFREDKEALAYYNLQDCVLVTEIFEHTQMDAFYIERVLISGLLIDRLGISTAAFDHIYLPRLHRKGYVASNKLDINRESAAGGGYVLEPDVGLHHGVIVLDFKSLYPSIIRTFKIDPLSRLVGSENGDIETPVDVKFSSHAHILPDYLENLFDKRAEAKERGNTPLSQAIKILMNSFYGVMGSGGCRFYHADLPHAITGTGQWLLKELVNALTNKGYTVLYGDTDSVFVAIDQKSEDQIEKKAHKLALDLNQYFSKLLRNKYNVSSFLEIEYEKAFEKIYFPHVRGGASGAKKKYVGLSFTKNYGELGEINFSGMEYVRSDWTRLAKDFQWELYRRFFCEEDIESWIKTHIDQLKNGELDDKLVYNRKLTKDVSEYTKSTPPHVRAALQLDPKERGRTVQYVMTLRGPVPIERDHADIDYEHYISKQLQPVAETVLQYMDTNFEDILIGSQLTLF